MTRLERVGWLLAATVGCAALVGSGIAALLLPGTSDQGSETTLEPAPASTQAGTPASARPSCPDCTAAEIDYLAEVRDQAQHAGNAPDHYLINVGWGLCDSIAVNGHVTGAEPVNGQISRYDTRVVIDAATAKLCPELRPDIADYLSPAPSHT